VTILGPDAWKRAIGVQAWNHIMRASAGRSPEDLVADVLTKASEAGFRAPEVAPRVTPEGTRVLWPREDGAGTPVLTAAGLEAHYAVRGHGFILLRMPQLVRGAAGSLLPRLQEVLAAYEEQCTTEKVSALPGWADLTVFVGGREGGVIGTAHGFIAHARELLEGLVKESPEPGKVHRVHVPGSARA
jgi:hypothetical protein